MEVVDFSCSLYVHSLQLYLTSPGWLTLRMESSAKIFWYHTAEAQHIQNDMPGTQPQEEIQQQMQNNTGRYAYLFTRLLEGWVNDLPFDLIHFIAWYRKKKKNKKHLKWIASRNCLPWGNTSLNRRLLSRSGRSRGHSVGSLIGCTVVIYLRESVNSLPNVNFTFQWSSPATRHLHCVTFSLIFIILPPS